MIKTKDILTMASVALGTATLTVAAFLEKPLNAGDESLLSITPKLVINNIVVTMPADPNQHFKAGDKPEFEICAVNTVNRPVQATFIMSMTATSPRSLVSRTPATPAMLWTQDETLALGPKETKRLKIPTGAALPANQEISVLLVDASPPAPSASAPTSGITAGSPFSFPVNVAEMRFSTASTTFP